LKWFPVLLITKPYKLDHNKDYILACCAMLFHITNGQSIFHDISYAKASHPNTEAVSST